MLKRWRKSTFSKVEFDQFLDNVRALSKKYPTLVFVPQNTGENWLGIKNATLGMFPQQSVILPQEFSRTLLDENQVHLFFDTIKKNQVQSIIFSGLPQYSLNWINRLKVYYNIKIGVIYHGGLAELTGNINRQLQMKNIIVLANSGIISKIGVVKDGLDHWFKQQTKTKIFRVLPQLSLPKDLKIQKRNDGKIHIGVFGNSSYNKNRHTQVVAASMVENSIVHVLAPNEFEYALPNESIVVHESLSRNAFLALLGSMDINLYCSYSESWGQVVLESLSLGVPCLYSNNSGLSEFISSEFMVSAYDNPFEICQKIKQTLKNKDQLLSGTNIPHKLNNNQVADFLFI